MNAEDRRLIRETLAGRSDAFGELVLSYQDRLYNAILRLVDQPEDAADVVQEAFVSAHGSLRSFEGSAEFFTWLYRIAFNHAMTWQRKKKPVTTLNAADYAEPFTLTDPAAGLTRNEDAAALAKAMTRLSDEHKRVLVLKEIEDLRYEEISKILGIPVGTVRSRLHRARLELHDRILELEREEEGRKLPQSC